MATVRAEPSRPRVRVELALGLAVFAYYLVVSHLGGAARDAMAVRHAESVYGLEQALWLDIEPGLNRALRQAGFYGPLRPEPDLLQWLDLLAIGTICDVVPLTGLGSHVQTTAPVPASRQTPEFT